MTAEPEDYPDDPILEALGLKGVAHPEIPPHDVVVGFYEDRGATFRLYHKRLGMYMEVPMSRRAFRGKWKENGSVVFVRADGDYDGDVVIGFTAAAPTPEEEPEQVQRALYASYAYVKTTPWHE